MQALAFTRDILKTLKDFVKIAGELGINQKISDEFAYDTPIWLIQANTWNELNFRFRVAHSSKRRFALFRAAKQKRALMIYYKF